MSEKVRDCFVTGKLTSGEDAESALKQDGKVMLQSVKVIHIIIILLLFFLYIVNFSFCLHNIIITALFVYID